jgi:hypothetical protein
MHFIIGWIIFATIVGIILVIMFLLRPVLRRRNKGKYIIYDGHILERKDLSFFENELGRQINEEDIKELNEENVAELGQADRKWFEENKATLKMRGYL